MELLNTVLLIWLAASTTLTAVFVWFLYKKLSLYEANAAKTRALDKIKNLTQELCLACTQVIEISNALRIKLILIEKLRRKTGGRHSADQEEFRKVTDVEKQLSSEIQAVQSLAKSLRHAYLSRYQPAVSQVLTQGSEAARLKDSELVKLLKELDLLRHRLEEIQQKLDNIESVEKTRVLVGYFSRMLNYAYLSRETGRAIADRIICLKD